MIKARAVLLSCEELSPQLLLLLRSPLCSGPAASPLTCGVRWSRGFGGGLSESRKARGSESVLKLIRSPTASGSGRCVRDEALGGGVGGCCASTQRPRATEASRTALLSRARCVRLPRHTGPGRSGLGDPHGTSRHLRSRSPLRHIRNIQHSLTYTGLTSSHSLIKQSKGYAYPEYPPPPPHTHTHRLVWRRGGGGMLENIFHNFILFIV